MKHFLLVDCNNFYVSCERVFNPKLLNKPVVVLGSNDACIIARSNEAKALGIPMGVPAFEYTQFFKKHKVIVYSANFTLYGDLSNRVMQTLTEYASDIEIYSVDEAFLHVVYPTTYKNLSHYAQFIKAQVKQKTGIPVSIGIGQTKTLAKIANKIAKKQPSYKGVCDISTIEDIDALLATINVADIWGIGHRYAKLLNAHTIMTARDFKYANDAWVRKNLTIVGLKTLLELRGISCLPLEDSPQPKDSITVSRLFGKKTQDKHSIKEALADYTACAAQKARAQNSLVGHITIFALTNRYQEPNNYFFSTGYSLAMPTAHTPTLIHAAYKAFEHIFKPGLFYKKVGITLNNLIPSDQIQYSTFIETPEYTRQKQNILMHTIDHANQKWGNKTLTFAASGIQQPWKMHQAHKSARFTTDWNEILTIELT